MVEGRSVGDILLDTGCSHTLVWQELCPLVKEIILTAIEDISETFHHHQFLSDNATPASRTWHFWGHAIGGIVAPLVAVVALHILQVTFGPCLLFQLLLPQLSFWTLQLHMAVPGDMSHAAS